MAEHVPSQARFIGGLALGMIALALVFAVFVLVAVGMAPPA
jgi:hypothetical protein